MERFNACVQCKTKEVHFKHIECTLSVLPDEHKKITILYIYIYICPRTTICPKCNDSFL